MMELKMQNFKIGTRVGLALALPIAGLFAFSLWILAGYYRSAHEMNGLREMAEFAPVVSALVHELQKERGISVGFIGSGGAAFAERLPAQYRETDTKRAELTRSLPGFSTAHSGRSLMARIAAAQDAVNGIETWRHALAERAITAPEMTGHYSDAIAKLIGIIEEMLLVSSSADLTRTISAYTYLLQAKERAGLERAIGSAGFAAHRFDPDSYMRFIELINQQQLYLNEFRFFASARQFALLEQALSNSDASEVERMRRIVLESRDTGSTGGINAERWFDTMTGKINLLKSVEDSVASYLVMQAGHAGESAQRAAKLVSALAAIVLVLTVMLAAALARGIIFPIIRITNSMGKLAARDETVKIEDNRRGDEIGDMARAMIVFQENLRRVVQAEERLKSEAILRLHHRALGSISQGVLITDAEQRITYANAAFQRITGYDETEVLGRSPALLHGAETNQETLAVLRASLMAGQSFSGQIMNYRKDGAPFWNELTISPVPDSEGRLTQFVCVMRDITENRRVEQELRIAATAFESLHGMMVTDADGIILRVNNAFIELTGYSAEEAVGRSPSILKSGRHKQEFYADMWQKLAATGSWSGEIWDRRKNGEIYPKWQTISAVKGADNRITHYVAAFSDISERKEAEEQIRNLAFYDPLTHLPNRRLLLDRLRQALALSDRAGRQGALLFIDLDNFKTLNDTQGHDVGDLLLIEVANRLQACIREGDTAARLGGDEFVILLENLDADESVAAAQAEVVGEKIRMTIGQVYFLNGREHHSTTSIGVTLFHGRLETADDLLKRADVALYQAKAGGRNILRFFDPDMQALVTFRAAMESDLRQAIPRGQLQLYYQPQIESTCGIIGAEALLRWVHPERGLVAPSEFIPLAEDTGLILPIGLWVLETACAQIKAWESDAATEKLRIAVNVSARQFRQPDFVAQVRRVLEKTGVNPARLKIEMTESMVLDDVADTLEKMHVLKLVSIDFSMDDFGTGYSSLAYLKQLPLNQLKIDRSFIRDLTTDPNDAAIVQAIITMGLTFGLNVIAEGVETEAQREFLDLNGCHDFQGYLFSKPVTATEFEKLVARNG